MTIDSKPVFGDYCLSAFDAAQTIKSFSNIPTFGSFLISIYGETDIRKKLTDAFLQIDKCDFTATDRKIRNWLNGKNEPQDRESIFICAFALGLDEAKTSLLLGLCCGSEIHYRNPKELVYAFALKNRWTYQKANEFFDFLPQTSSDDNERPCTVYTCAVCEDYQKITDEETFKKYYETHLNYFGELHNKAYYYFKGFMDVLISPDEEEKYSVEKIIELYLMPVNEIGKNRQSLDKIQKLIRRVFPSPTYIRNICARREDVPRNLLILLYLVTENCFQNNYEEWDESYLSPEEYFESRWWGINLMLVDCGMPTLNPNNPYDKLVLYALYTDGDNETMLERFNEIVQRIIK